MFIFLAQSFEAELEAELELENDVLEKERSEQEISANKRTISGLYGIICVIIISWVLALVGIFDVDNKALNTAFTLALVFTCIPIIVGHFIKKSESWYKYLCLICLCITCALTIMELSFHVILLYTLPLVFASQYKDKLTLWITYIMVVISMTAASVVGFYYGICDLNILFLSNYHMEHYINQATGAIQNLNFNDNPVYILVFLVSFPRAMIAFMFVLMLRFVNEQSRKDAVKIARLRWESDTDLSTSTYNKGKYEEMIKNYYPEVGRVAVVFWDLDNLKPINDACGHHIGDIYIKKLADAIGTFSNNTRRKIFRIGGDEFVMIIESPEENEHEKIIEFVKKTLALEELRGNGISASSGFSIGFGDLIEEVVREADSNMYFNKKKMKSRFDVKFN